MDILSVIVRYKGPVFSTELLVHDKSHIPTLVEFIKFGSHCSGFEPYISGTIGRYYNRIYYYFVKAEARWWYLKNFLGKCLGEM
jgi:hypothetical protein